MSDKFPSSAPHYCICFEDVVEAADRIRGVAHKTPVLTSRSLMTTASGGGDHNNDNDDGQDYFFKVEAMQKTGSFKFRGALNAVKYHIETTLQKKKSKEEKSKCDSCSSTLIIPVVTHSSGNHAQALALASKLASSENTTTNNTNNNDTNTRNKNTQDTRTIVKATIVMPRNCPNIKKQAVVDFGAAIVLVENTNEARKKEAARIVSTTPGAVFVHPSENPQVMAGQGTVCLEFVEQVRTLLWKSKSKSKNKNTVSGGGGGGGELDAVIIPVGGGGLAAGNCISLRGLLGKKVKIILAEPAQLDDAKRSFTAGQLLGHHDDPTNHHPLESVADGLKTTLGPNTWPIVRDFVDDIITVSEQDILRATKLVWERLKVVIEPSAGVGVAVAHSAEFHHKYSTRHGIQNVGIILCGGNVDILKISSLMQEMGL